MTDPFVAEIRIVGFNFAPTGWATCDGQILPISQNTALFSLLGTTYGGNGSSTFALPNLQGSAPMHPGQGPGLSLRDLGEQGGSQTATLLQGEIPVHTHQMKVDGFPAAYQVPAANRGLARSTGGQAYQTTSASGLAPMGTSALTPAGGSLPHNNMQPYLTMNFVIALQGIFPPRS